MNRGKQASLKAAARNIGLLERLLAILGFRGSLQQ
jgi:hypothetical protein